MFVEAPHSLARLDDIGLAIRAAWVANMVEGGRTPILPPEDLHRRGFDLIVHPVAAILAEARTIEHVLNTIRYEGTTEPVAGQLYAFERRNELLGPDAHRANEAQVMAHVRSYRS